MEAAVTFDVWFTLLSLEPAEEEAYLERLEEAAAEVVGSWRRSPRARHPRHPDPRVAARSALLEAVQASRAGRSISLADQAIRAARLAGRVSRPLDFPRALEEVAQRTKFRVEPSAARVLGELAAQGLRIGVISNTIGEPGEVVQRALDRAGLSRWISGWAFSDQLPWTKPAPEIFHHCLRVLRVPPTGAIHVGDGASDIAGARAAGFRASVLYTGLQNYSPTYRRLYASSDPRQEHPDRTIRRLEEVPAIARELLQAPARNHGKDSP
jgi:HAD superfamily hydrolase (TIGR01549 family)